MTPKHRRRGPKGPVRNPAKDITELLTDLHRGDAEASSQLMPLVYSELRKIAASHFRHERPGHTLQPTALIHEAYLRLLKPEAGPWFSRKHFFAVASRSMRQILVEHARKRSAAKRGGSLQRVDLDKAHVSEREKPDQILALDEALTRLEALNERQCRIVELRYFAGLSVKETAEVLGVGVTTVKDDWAVAKAWLQRKLAEPQ
jgi:RNA polymerase sigma factor (TIGR02999 family)